MDFAAHGEDDSQKVDAGIVVDKFKRFIREFKYKESSGDLTTMKYRDRFAQNCAAGLFKLEVNLNDLKNDKDGGQLCAENLQNSPTEFIPLFEDALQALYREFISTGKFENNDLPVQVPHIQLELRCDVDLEGTWGNIKPMLMRDLISNQVEKLVVIQGIVVSVRVPRRKARRVVLMCTSCEKKLSLKIGAGKCAAHIPRTCDGGGRDGTDRCPPNSWQTVEELNEVTDEQELKIQELPEHVPVGEMPRSFELYAHQYLVDSCTPGTRLTVIGVFCATERVAGSGMSSGRRGGTNTVKYSYIQCLGVQVAQGNQASLNITDEEQERFAALAKDPEVRQKIFRSIAPSICASEKDVVNDVKQALACLLFGGSRKKLADGTRMRGDINVLLLGDPGTAKSQFLKFANAAAPIAVYTSGKGSSAAGLTAAVTRDKNGFALEGGAMVLADGGIVCIDEFDKMDTNDRVAIHEAMEQQTISIAKAGITTMLNTRCSVLAAANPRFGTHDDLTSTSEQIDFESTILSRFDMMFLVKDVRDAERDKMICHHMVSLHRGDVMEEQKGELSVLTLRKYIRYCRSRCDPRISAEAAEVLKNHYVSIRKAMKGEKAIPITVRQLEAIVRISESLARMELQQNADVSHVEAALRLFTVSTLDSANRDRTTTGIDLLTDAEKKELLEAEEQVRRLIPKGGRKSKYQLESMLVSNAGVSDKMARRVLHIMTMRGELQEKNNNTLFRAQ